MPELPDVVVYLEALEQRILGKPIEGVRIQSPFVLRTVEPPIQAIVGRRVIGLRRLGKRLILDLDDDLHLVIHLMIAGRLRWKPRGAKPPGRIGLAAFDFPNGTLLLTEAGSKRRASMHLVRGTEALAIFDRGGLEPLEADQAAFTERLLSENHTLKRALADPRLFSGIGNAYSDEILHRARLSPLQLTSRLDVEEIARLYRCRRDVLTEWTDRLRQETGTQLSREGHRVPGGDGSARALPRTLSGLRHARAADPLRRQRNQLLSHLPDRWAGSWPTGDSPGCLREDWPRSLDEMEERLAR